MPVKGRETHRNARRNCRASAPKRANRALLSPPYSLLATCPIRGSSPPQATHGAIAVRARPSAPTTHYLLPSPPYSLLKKYSWSIRVHYSWFYYLPFRGFRGFRGFLPQCTHGDSAVQARPSAPTTHCLLPSSPYSLLKKIFVVHSCPFVVLLSALSWFPSLMYARHNCRAQRKPTAKCPRTTFYLLLPTLYSHYVIQSALTATY